MLALREPRSEEGIDSIRLRIAQRPRADVTLIQATTIGVKAPIEQATPDAGSLPCCRFGMTVARWRSVYAADPGWFA
jgi:hypothetical protein